MKSFRPYFAVCSLVFLLFASWIDHIEGFTASSANPITLRRSRLSCAAVEEIVAKKSVKIPRNEIAAEKSVKAPKIEDTEKPIKIPRKVKPKNYTSTSQLTLEISECSADMDSGTADTVGKKVKAVSTVVKGTVTTVKVKVATAVKSNIGETDNPDNIGSIERIDSVASIASVESVAIKPLILTVYGEPTPLSRHMVSRGHMYNPSAGLQKEFATACLNLLPAAPLTGPLEATLFFYFSRPKNHYGTGKNAHVLKPLTASNWHSKRKDLDNLVKFVLDALNAKAYEDDSQIAVIKSAKFYTEGEAYTKVILRSLTEKDYDNFRFE